MYMYSEIMAANLFVYNNNNIILKFYLSGMVKEGCCRQAGRVCPDFLSSIFQMFIST